MAKNATADSNTKPQVDAQAEADAKKAAAQAEVDELVAKAQVALKEYEKFDQETIDRIVGKASLAALNKHLQLAKLAVEETHCGLVEDKATKNIFACEHVTHYMAGQRTVGIINENDVDGIV